MIDAGAIAGTPTRRWVRLSLAGVAWAGLVVWWWSTSEGRDLARWTPHNATRGNWWAIAAYMGVSLVRSLVHFPATIVTVAAGIMFGPVVGVAVAAVAANASATIGYSIGRNFRRPGDDSVVTSRLGAWTSRRRANSFEAVLLTRLLFLPYDLVNYGCGLLHVRRTPFITATTCSRSC